MDKQDSAKLSKWLFDHGITDFHINYLLHKDKKNIIANANIKKQGVYYEDLVFCGKTYTKKVMVAFNKTLDDSIIEIESGGKFATLAFSHYVEVSKHANDKFEICNLARLINPFSYDHEFELYNELLASFVKNEEIQPFLYPWQNASFDFCHQCKPISLDSNKRIHFSDIGIEFQKYTILSIDDFEKQSKNRMISDFAKIWRSYLDRNIELINKAKKNINEKPQPSTIPTTTAPPTNTPDGLPIPWLMKEAERKPQLPAQMTDAAYRLFRKLNQRNHDNLEDLFNLLTPEYLPDFVAKRNTQTNAYLVELTLTDGRKHNYDNFRKNAGKKFI